jgi:putative transposase
MNALQSWQLLLVATAGWMNRNQQDVIAYIQEENRILKHNLKGKRIRFTDDERRRLAWKGRALGRRVLRDVASIVTPDTILRWHRKLIAMKYDGSAKRGPGRPRVAEEVSELTVRMARENPGWGYTTIRGALFNLGHTVARETVRNILKEHGIVPAPERRKRMPWSTFLKSHWGSIAAADFFTVEVWSCVGLTRYYVLFFIKLSTRRVHVAGITEYPYGEWMNQIGRNLTDPFDGILINIRYVILDRDPLYTEAFRNLLKQAGIKTIRLPPRSPNLKDHVACCTSLVRSGETSGNLLRSDSFCPWLLTGPLPLTGS